MSIQMATYNDETMQSGKFYELLVNKDNANLLLPAPPFNINFENQKFINIDLETSHSIEIWQVEKYGDKERHTNITNRVDWYILHPENKLVINANEPISGYIKFI